VKLISSSPVPIAQLDHIVPNRYDWIRSLHRLQERYNNTHLAEAWFICGIRKRNDKNYILPYGNNWLAFEDASSVIKFTICTCGCCYVQFEQYNDSGSDREYLQVYSMARL